MKVSEKGECFSALPFKEGTEYPDQTVQFFETINKDSVRQIFGFNKYEYVKDSVNNKNKKYAFFILSGYVRPNHVKEYYIDYGMNYKKY